MFNAIIGSLLAIIVIIISKKILKSIRVLRYKGYNVDSLRITGPLLVAVLYTIVLIMCFL